MDAYEGRDDRYADREAAQTASACRRCGKSMVDGYTGDYDIHGVCDDCEVRESDYLA